MMYVCIVECYVLYVFTCDAGTKEKTAGADMHAELSRWINVATSDLEESCCRVVEEGNYAKPNQHAML